MILLRARYKCNHVQWHFGICPSSVLHCTHSNGICHTGFADPAHKLSAILYVLLCVQYKTPDDGQRNCLKHVEFYSKNKFEKLVHLNGKSVPLKAWSGPEGSRKLRFPDYVTMAQNGGKVVSLMHWPPLPQEILPVLTPVEG